MSSPDPPFPDGPQFEAGFREAFRVLGLWSVLPWGLAISALLLAGEGALAWALRNGAEPATPGEISAVLAGPCLVACALFLCFVVGISGTVSSPLGRAAAGRAAGLAAVAGLSVAVFAGCAGPVSGRLDAASVPVLLAAPLAGAGAFGWARMSYDSTAGAALASVWAALLALVPLLPLVAAR